MENRKLTIKDEGSLPQNSKLTIRDFRDREGKFVYKSGDYEIVFFEYTGAWAKMFIQVWYLEGEKRYLKEEKTVDRRFTANRITVKESNRQWWYWVNKFNKRYCHEED